MFDPPIDGIAGSLWRTIALPLRVTAPVAELVKRRLTGTYWSESLRHVDRRGPQLSVSDHEEVQQPSDGVGPLNHRCYQIQITGSTLDATQLLERFRTDPNAFAPTAFATFVPDPHPNGMAEGETYEVKLPGPWNGPILVRSVEQHRIRFETLDGHMEAGWIEFTTAERSGSTEFTIESFARSGDPVFDVIYQRLGLGKAMQTLMWVKVLEAAVGISEGTQRGRASIETIVYRRTL